MSNEHNNNLPSDSSNRQSDSSNSADLTAPDLGFIPPPPSGRGMNSGSSPNSRTPFTASDAGMSSSDSGFINNIKTNVKGKVNDYIDEISSNIPGDAGEIVSEIAREYAGKAIDSLVQGGADRVIGIGKNAADKIINGGATNVPDMPSIESGKFIHAERLDVSGSPIRMNLNTGIPANTTGQFYHTSIAGYASPLHLSFVNYAIPTNTSVNHQVGYFFDQVISFELKNAIAGAVGFSVPTTDVTSSKLVGALNALWDALQVYYYYNSILMYAKNPQNRNEGMLALRNAIDSTTINYYYNIGRLLCGTPIPPNMLIYTFYLSQVFSAGPLPGSPLLKTVPMAFDSTTGYPSNNTSYLSSIITNLRGYDGTWALLAKACPNWINNMLPDCSFESAYDPQYLTIWANLPYQIDSTGPSFSYKPTATTVDTVMRYNSFTNTLDGGAFALTSFYCSDLGDYVPSLVKPRSSNYINATNNSSRLSWYGSPGAFRHPAFYKNFAYSRLETWAVYTDGTNSSQEACFQAGSEVCVNVTGSTVVQTSVKILQWMLSIKSIVPRVDNRFKSSPKGGDNFKRNKKSNKRGK